MGLEQRGVHPVRRRATGSPLELADGVADVERSARPGKAVGSPPHVTDRTAASTSQAVAVSRSAAVGGRDEVGVRPRGTRLDLCGERASLAVGRDRPAQVIARLRRDGCRPVPHQDGVDVVASREVEVVRLTRCLLVPRGR